MGTGIGGAERVCASEGDAGPGRPVVHSLDAAGETDDGARGVGHGGGGGGWGERARRGGADKRKVLEDEREAPSS